jgi:uncharacterized protein (DUF983 family)
MINVSKSQAILEARCPRCRRGKMFRYPNWQYTRFSDMYELCPVCGLRFEIEPGFFFMAMYVSYALSIAIAVTLGVALYVLADDPPVTVYMLTISGAIILAVPLLFRYSRVLAIYFLSGIKYNNKYDA